MNDSRWEVPVGLDQDFQVWVTQDDGVTPIVFTGSETFVCQVWQGDDMAPVSGVLSASWVGGDPVEGAFTASVLGAGTASLASDYYAVRINVLTGSGRMYRAYDGALWLQDSPGAAAAPLVYCSLQDLLDVGGAWLVPLMQEGGKTSFLAERGRAKRRLDDVILSRSRPLSWGAYPWGVADRLITMQVMSYEQPDIYLAGLLKNGALVVTPEVNEACAYLAAAFVCERQFTWDGADPHAARGAYYHDLWRARLMTLTPGIDVNGDGVAEWFFDLNVASSR